MLKIVALNEESSEESDEEDVQLVTREAQEDQAVAQYKEALELQRQGDVIESAEKLRELVNTALLQEVEKSEVQQYQPLLALKYSCLKNLATLDLKAGKETDALDYFLQALRLDDTDPTLLYKVGCLAEKLNKFDLASVSFYEGLQCSPNHWLCLDRLVTVLFATNGYLTCLSFVAKGLQKDPEYTKCLVLRDAMLKESPSLSQHYQDYFPRLPLLMDGKADEESTKEIIEEAIDIRRRWSEAGKPRVRGPIGLTRKLESPNWISLAEEIMRLFKYIRTEGIDASTSQTIDFDKVEEIEDGIIADDEEEEEMEIEEADGESTKQGEEGDESVTNGSKKHRKRLFLENWVLGGQRRSARVRSTTRKDEDTSLADSLKRLIPMSLLPDSLKDGAARLMLDENSMDTMDMFKIFEDSNKPQVSKVSSRRPSANTAASIAENIAKEDYFGTDTEKQDVAKFLEEHIGNWGIFHLLTDFVKNLAAKSTLTWPHKLVTIWIECYQVMRQSLIHVSPLSQELSDEELESDGRLSLLHAELLSDRLRRQKGRQPPLVLLEDVAQIQLMDCWTAEEALRINWLRAHVYLQQKDTEGACNSLRAVINQLEAFPEGLNLINCRSVIFLDETENLLSSLECSHSLAGAEQLWKEGQWKRLAELLEGSFQVQSSVEFRHIQLEMFADALVRLDDPTRCFTWTETALHEAVGHYLTNQLAHWAKCIEKLLASLVYCLQEFGMEATIGSLANGRLSRLFQDLCQIVCAQLETSEMVMPIETVDPWILLQQILAHEEKNKPPGEVLAVVDEEEVDEIPASVSVLFVAHEHLGRKSWCCTDEGSLLIFALEQIIPRLRSTEFASFRSKLSTYIEQMFFCLYEFPTSKRPKGRTLHDHSVPHIELTFESTQLLLDFYRPDEMPEFDSYRVGSISADAEVLIKKVLSLAPPEFSPQKTLENLRLYVEGKADSMPKIEHKLLPEGLRDINYLLADYYFKNNELPKAVRYYMLDLCHNPNRLDAWAGMALARGSQLETQLNSCSAINETEFIKRAEKAEKCFEQVLRLSGGRHTVICIEYGSFVYMLHSFCSRLLKQATNTLSIEQFEILEEKKSSTLDTAESCFKKAMLTWKQEAEDDQDERWLHHYMLGKVSEKRHQQPWLALHQYQESARLLQEHKSAYPAKISYTNPTELSIEALEVHYRIHSCLLKHLEAHEGRSLPDEQKVRKILKEQRQGPLGTEEKEAALKRKMESEMEEQAKKAKLETEEEAKKPKSEEEFIEAPAPPTALATSESETAVAELIASNAPAMTAEVAPSEISMAAPASAMAVDEPLRRVSQESSTTVTTTTSTSTSSSSSSSDDSSSSSSDEEENAAPKAQEEKKEEPYDPKKDHAELIGLCLEALEECSIRFPEHFKTQYRLAHYHFKSKLSKNLEKSKELLLGPYPNSKLHGLFQDKKPSNFFNGIWRIPVNEIDRPGCFASHMSRSMVLAMEIVKETKDYRMLVDMCLQLRRTPDPDKKYLRDNERKELSEQALLLAAQVLRQTMKETKPEDLTGLIIEMYKLLQKVQRTQNNKEPHALGRLLCDAYILLHSGKVDPKVITVDIAIKFAQQELARVKSAAKAAEVNSMASSSSLSVSESNPVPIAAPPKPPTFMHQPRKPYIPGTSRRGRPPLSRPPLATTGRGRAKPNPFSNYFPNPFEGLDAASLGYLQNELVRQMMQGYSAAMPSVSAMPPMPAVSSVPMSSMATLSSASAMPSMATLTSASAMPQPASLQKITKGRPNLSVTPIVPERPRPTLPKHNTQKTVKKLLEQSRKMLETASRMQQQPRKHSPLPHLPPGIVASAISSKSPAAAPMTPPGPPPAKKPLLSQSSPFTVTKVASAGRNSPLSLVKPRKSSPIEIIKKPPVPRVSPMRHPGPHSWGPTAGLPRHLQRNLPLKKQHPPPQMLSPQMQRPMPSAGSQRPQPAHMASRVHNVYSAGKDFHFPSDISVMPTVIQHTKQHQQFNLPSSISVSPATVPAPKVSLPAPKPQPPKEPPKRKPSDDIIVLD